MSNLPLDFDIESYLEINPDVKNSGIDPIFHYLNHGITEGRKYKRKNPVLGLALIAKDEAPYILEWIAYHMVLGVDKFIVADNNSIDGTKEILVKLHLRNLIDLIHFPGYKDKAPQLSAYSEILVSSNGLDWLGFIDTDEFISIDSGFELKKILSNIFSDDKIGGVGINWSIYGSSGILNYDGRLVIERFKYRAEKNFYPNHHIKSILNLNSLCLTGNNSHKFHLSNNKIYKHANFDDLVANFTHGDGLSQKICWNPIKLNHYMIKSKDEFAIRSKKPTVSNRQYNVKDENYFIGHDRNEVFDPIREELISLTKSKLAELNLIIAENSDNLNVLFNLDGRSGCINDISCVNNHFRILGWSYLFAGNGSEATYAAFNHKELEIISVRAIKREDIFQDKNTLSPFCGFELVCYFDTIDYSSLNGKNQFELVFERGSQKEVLNLYYTNLAV